MTTTTVAQLLPSLRAQMKQTVLVILLSMTASSLLLGCQAQAEKDAAAKAKSDLDLTIIKQFRDLNNQQHELTVGTAEKLYGRQVAQTLVLCYEDGYDMVQGENHKFTNDPKLQDRNTSPNATRSPKRSSRLSTSSTGNMRRKRVSEWKQVDSGSKFAGSATSSFAGHDV